MANVPELFPDFSKLMLNFDPTKMTEELTKMLAQLNLPGVNMDALVASQRENMEALNTANTAAVEALQNVAKWQVKILQETMNEFSSTVEALGKAGSPQEVAAKRAELASEAFKTALNNMNELANIMTEANHKAINTLNKRFTESADEIKDVLKMR